MDINDPRVFVMLLLHNFKFFMRSKEKNIS
jgi:hypothetical protein